MIQGPRGELAVVWVDPSSNRVSTNHVGLRAMLERGVKDWEGRLVFPRDGRACLTALYDYLFVNGYGVHWVRIPLRNRSARRRNESIQ